MNCDTAILLTTESPDADCDSAKLLRPGKFWFSLWYNCMVDILGTVTYTIVPFPWRKCADSHPNNTTTIHVLRAFQCIETADKYILSKNFGAVSWILLYLSINKKKLMNIQVHFRQVTKKLVLLRNWTVHYIVYYAVIAHYFELS